MHKTSRLSILAVIAALAEPAARAHEQAPPPDPVAPLIGSWGQPPVDGKPGLTGTILSIFRDASGAMHVDAVFAPSWTCTLKDRTVTWNGATSRFEWPSPSPNSDAGTCWLALEPGNAAADVRLYCPYSCTRAEVNAITLARLSATRLTPPVDVVPTFCASADPLRQALCTPGPIQDAIAARVTLADRVRVLDDGRDQASLEPDTELALVDVLAQCKTAGTTACLEERLMARNRDIDARVRARQAVLAREKAASEAKAISIPGAKLPESWSRSRFHVTDQMLPSLTLTECDDTSCTVALEGETNYTFGYNERRGFCSLDFDAFFTSATEAFGYVDVADTDRNEAGAGAFANFCRVDLRRDGANVQVSLRGTGCAAHCHDVADPELSGLYKPAGTPSFKCGEDLTALGWIEQNLCMDADLGILDREMAAAFAAARKAASPNDAAALTASQREWLAARESCNADRRYSCLKEQYQQRIATLKKR